jgi:hypothetical protein
MQYFMKIHAVFYENSCSIWVKFLQYLREVGAGSSEVVQNPVN